MMFLVLSGRWGISCNSSLLLYFALNNELLHQVVEMTLIAQPAWVIY